MSSKPSKSGSIVRLEYSDKNVLYSAFMPFVKNGGLFISSNKHFELGDEVFLVLTLFDNVEEIPVPAKVVWITPIGAQSNRKPGIGVQFLDEGNARLRIETLLAGMLNLDHHTDTM